MYIFFLHEYNRTFTSLSVLSEIIEISRVLSKCGQTERVSSPLSYDKSGQPVCICDKFNQFAFLIALERLPYTKARRIACTAQL